MQSPVRWQGSKRRLASAILPHIRDHCTYAEPCCGSAAIFWAKPREASSAEVLNDVDGELVNFYQVLHKHGRRLAGELDGMPYGRSLFDRLRASRPRGTYRRAMRFWYLNRVCFGGRRRGATFGVQKQRRTYVLPARILGDLDAVIERLRGVSFESVDVERFIALYDAPATLFFVDPPYYGLSQHYAAVAFGPADHGSLARRLGACRGTWLLTYNDCAEVRRLYRGATRHLTTRYTAGCNSRSGGYSDARELLISNRPLRRRPAPSK